MKVSSQKGFTLIEVLAAIAVGGMLLATLLSSIFQTTNVTTYSNARITAMEDVKTVARWMAAEFRSAGNVSSLDIGSATPSPG